MLYDVHKDNNEQTETVLFSRSLFPPPGLGNIISPFQPFVLTKPDNRRRITALIEEKTVEIVS